MDTYTILGQKQIQKPSPAGGWMECMEVRFVTSNEVVGSVCVPLSQYNKDTVGTMIADRVKAIGEVHSLGS